MWKRSLQGSQHVFVRGRQTEASLQHGECRAEVHSEVHARWKVRQQPVPVHIRVHRTPLRTTFVFLFIL